MQIKKDTKVKVPYRPGLGTGAVLQVAEAPGGYTRVDVVFEKDGKRFLETFPQSRVEPVADIFQRYQNCESDHPTDFFLKQLATNYHSKTWVVNSLTARQTCFLTKSC